MECEQKEFHAGEGDGFCEDCLRDHDIVSYFCSDSCIEKIGVSSTPASKANPRSRHVRKDKISAWVHRLAKSRPLLTSTQDDHVRNIHEQMKPKEKPRDHDMAGTEAYGDKAENPDGEPVDKMEIDG
jgi:hypothetical protein